MQSLMVKLYLQLLGSYLIVQSPGQYDPLVDELADLEPVGTILTREQAKRLIVRLLALRHKYNIKHFGGFYGRYLKVWPFPRWFLSATVTLSPC